MEAIGAIASIIGVAGAGAKLSIVLFEFASTVGSAGHEVKQIGIEISLFCSVLKQLESTLAKAKAYRYSLSAIETTQQILNRCQEVFQDIEAIVNGLRKRPGSERSAEATTDLIARVKWTFKRSQVQLLRMTWESCKVTLHLMLSTLEFAQKIASRRVSTLETQAEDEHEETMTRSLIIAHQCTIDTLQRLEEEEVRQPPTNSDLLSPPLTPGPSPIGRVVRTTAGHKPSRSFDNQNLRLPSPTGISEWKRASIWINGLIFDNSPLPTGFRRQTWGDAECTLFLDQQPYCFLQKWTDQGEHLSELRRRDIEQPLLNGTHDPLAGRGGCETEPSALEDLEPPLKRDTMKLQAEHWSPIIPRSDSKRAPSPKLPPHANLSHAGDMTLETPNNTGPMVLPAALRKYNLEGRSGSKHERSKTSSSPQLSPPPPEPSVSKSLNAVSTLPKDQFSSESLDSASSTLNNGSVEIFKTFPVSMGDPCYIVLPAALKKCGINAPWEQYALYIVYGDKERCLGMEEKPLILFKQLDKEGSPCSC